MSGKKARQARRIQAQRPAEPVRRSPDRRLLLLGGAVAAAVAVAAVLGLSAAFGGDKKTHGAVGARLPGAAAVTSVFAGIPQHGLYLGSATAPVTMVEYIDLQCPYCGAYERETFPQLVARFVRPGRVRVEMRPLDFVGHDSVRGRNALFAAAAQDRAFQFAALLYANQGVENTGWLSEDMVRAAAASIRGVDAAEVVAAKADGVRASRIERQRAAQGVTGVPTIFVGGRKLVNPSQAALFAALRSAL